MRPPKLLLAVVLAVASLMTLPRPAAACLALIGSEWQTDIILTGVAVDRHPGGIVGHLAEIFGGESPTIEYEIRLDGVEKGPAWLRRATTSACSSTT